MDVAPTALSSWVTRVGVAWPWEVAQALQLSLVGILAPTGVGMGFVKGEKNAMMQILSAATDAVPCAASSVAGSVAR